jgi:chromosome segregation ATPase
MPPEPSNSNETQVSKPNRRLTATLEADYETLQDDLRQATELAADYQRQLDGKSGESFAFQTLLEKTFADLSRLQGDIAELRRERHFLANEVMRAGELEVHLTGLTEERDALKKELEQTREALASAELTIRQLREAQDGGAAVGFPGTLS